MKYETLEEIHARIKNTVIMFDGAPALVYNVDGPDRARRRQYDDFIVQFETWPRKNPNRKEIISLPQTHPGFCDNRFTLGYANYAGHAQYVTRVPYRGRRQGLCSENTASRPNEQEQVDRLPKIQEHLFGKYPGIGEMLVDKYQSLEECYKSLFNTSYDEDAVIPTSMAFNRRLALRKDRMRGDAVVFYKGEAAAFGDLKGMKIVPGKEALREFLLESKVPL